MPSTSFIAYLDCSTGISEDMLLAALYDAGVSLATLHTVFASLHLSISTHRGQRAIAGVHGTDVSLAVHSSLQLHESDILARLSASALSSQTQRTVSGIIHHLVIALSKVNGVAPNDIYLNAASLAFCIAIEVGLDELHIQQLYVSPLPLTSVASEDGSALAGQAVSLEILRDTNALWKPSVQSDVVVTPLSAAILSAIATFDVPVLAIRQVAYGLQHKSQEKSDVQANSTPRCVRLAIGLSHDAADESETEDIATDRVTVVSTNIDTMDGEQLGGLMERFFELGALDVTYTPIQMKKNRPATMITIICSIGQEGKLAHALLRETTTLGVRVEHVQRYIADREQQRIETPFGTVLVKVKRLGGRIVSARPEFEECQRIARERHLPLLDVYHTLTSIVQRQFSTTIIEENDESI